MRQAKLGFLLLPLLIMLVISPSLTSAEPPPLNPPGGQSQGRFGIVEAYEAPNLAAASGAQWERLFFWWNQVQPTGPQDWKLDKIIPDQKIDAERQRGMTLVGLLGNPPSWATRNGSVPANLSSGVTDPQNYWAGFVSKMVKQYAGRIDYWIVWNEPDIDAGGSWSTWAGSEEEYYQMLKAAYLAAKAANPAAKIIFGGTTFWADSLVGRKLFLERVLERAVLDPTARANNYYFDIVNLHIYSKSQDMYDIPQSYREVLSSYGIEKPIWIGESNVVPWNDPAASLPPGGYRATLEEQASFVIQGFALAMAANVERISIYKMMDGTNVNGEAYGLVRNDGTTRPAYAAFQTAAKLFSGFSGARYDDLLGVNRVIMESGDKKVTVLWNPDPKPKTVRLRAIGVHATQYNKYGQAVPLKVPIVYGQNFYSFDMALATANVADFSPNYYIIGGDPVILVEEGIGQGIPLSQTEMFYPITGHSVGGGFLEFFNKYGGTAMFGYPRSQEIKEGGKTVQYFQKARFEYFPEFAGTPYQVQLGLLQMDLARNQSFARVEPFEGTPDRVYFPETGHSLQGGFLRFVQQHGGLDVFGYPMSEEITQGNIKTQYFQRTRLEYHVSGPTQGALDIGNVGDEYMVARGLLTPPRP